MTMLSSTSKNIVFPELQKVFDLKIVARLKVPLKIPIITAGFSKEGRRWVEYLKKNKFVEEDKKEKLGYRYWHTLEVVMGSLKNSKK